MRRTKAETANSVGGRSGNWVREYQAAIGLGDDVEDEGVSFKKRADGDWKFH